MDRFIIEGNRNLSGTIQVSGAKNAILPAMATCLWLRETVCATFPASSTSTMAHLPAGARVVYENGMMSIDSRDIVYNEAP